MNSLFAQDWLVIPAIGIVVFLIFYMWTDKTLLWLHGKSLGQREEVIRLMELMFIEIDRKRITGIMLLTSFGLGALVFIIFWPNLAGGVIFGAIVTIFGWSIPKLLVRSIYDRRCGAFVNQMVDGMTLMANGIKAGLSVTQSMERVAESMPNPMSQEFNLVLSQLRLGRSVEEALNDLAERIPKPDVQMFVTAVNILEETGGNLAETFQTIVYTVRERQKIEKKIEALTAQGIMQGIIISCVPFVLLFIFWIMDPAFIAPLFNTTLGIIALVVMLVLQIIGGLMIRKIVKINV